MSTPQTQQELLPMKDVTPKKTTGHQPAPGAKPPVPKTGSGVKAPPPPAKPKTKKSTAIAVHQPQAPAQQKNVLQIIADVAARPDANPTVMRELLDMQKEIMADQAKRDFNAAFIALQAELPTIRRDGRIEVREKDPRTGSREHGRVQQSTPYATFNAIMTTIKPLLVKHGFALSFSTEPAGERLLVRGLLEGYGHERTTAFPLPAETSGSKNNVQGWGSSMSYGKRYCTIALLNIISEAPEDRDTDGEPNRGSLKAAKGGGFVDVPETIPVSEAQVEELKIAMEDARVSETNFCKHFGIQKVADLPADLFSAAKKQLADHKAKYQKGPARG
jgi:hypothetical protein